MDLPVHAFLLRKKIYQGCNRSVIAQNYVKTCKTLEVNDMCRLKKKEEQQQQSNQIQVDHRYIFLGRDSFLPGAASWGTMHKTTSSLQHANTP